MNKKKIISIALTVLILVGALGLFVFYESRHERFDYSEKSHIAMGTVVTQKVYGDFAAKHIEKTKAVIDGLDDMISWRESNSEIAKLNLGETLEVAYLADCIKQCSEISFLTDGAFDITVGGVSRLWNIGEENERIPSDEEIKTELQNVGYDKIKFAEDTVLLPDGVKIDLGAVGKGMACDMLKAYLDASDMKGAIISVGGSILAWGDYNKAGDKWQIAVAHPRQEGEYLGVLSIDEGFVSTSGDYERYFEKDGKRYHHILDATTGYPAETDLISVTIVCDSGIISDALSTACFILGQEKSMELLEKLDASAIFVDKDMNISVVGDIDFEY
jgi:thiamine biosynthesis lipoprotein